MSDRFTDKDSTYYEKALQRLQELENKIENHLLVEIPCVEEIVVGAGEPAYNVYYRDKFGVLRHETHYIKSFAEERLQQFIEEKR